MRIVNCQETRFPHRLFEITPGEVVEFEHGFHQKHRRNAKFLVMRVPAEYIRHEKRNRDGLWRIMVVNLETGDASLITTERMVRKFTSEVRLS